MVPIRADGSGKGKATSTIDPDLQPLTDSDGPLLEALAIRRDSPVADDFYLLAIRFAAVLLGNSDSAPY